MGILTNKQIDKKLTEYYKEHFGKRDTDEWLEIQAVNVRRFIRDGKTIILKCHIINGEVTEKIID